MVSFKNYVRVINKATNYYEKYDDQGRKIRVPQKGNDLWAGRKPMHKDTVFGHVNLKRKAVMTLSKAIDHYSTICYKPLRQAIAGMSKAGLTKKEIVSHFKKLEYKWNYTDVSKVEVWVFSDDREPMLATRKPLNKDFDEKKISSISDTGIQKILLNYLKAKGGDPQEAFTPEGIADMNQHIRLYKRRKFHQPIVKVRIVETMGNKFAVGQVGHKGMSMSRLSRAPIFTLPFIRPQTDNAAMKPFRSTLLLSVSSKDLAPCPKRMTTMNP